MHNHEAIIRRFYDAFSNNTPSEFDEILAKDWRALPPLPNNPTGREGQKQTLGYLHSVFENLHYKVEEVIVAGDRVTSRATMTGVQKGVFLGIAPTGKTMSLMTIEIHTLVDGKITETWHIEDFAGAIAQLSAT